MKLTINTTDKNLVIEDHDVKKEIPLYSKEAFEYISDLWAKVGWNEKYIYTFSWMGRPIIQLPEDMLRIQEIIYQLKPDVIIETGVAHGGSLIYYASLCKAMEHGRIIGIDIEIRPHNRKAIEDHELSSYITLIEGNSTAHNTLEKTKLLIKGNDVVLVILDSCHTKSHVRKELEMYQQFVTPGSYLVVTDGIMKDLYDVPRGQEEWQEDNPVSAVNEFLQENDNFILESPPWLFNESMLTKGVTHWPSAWLKRTY